MGAGRTGEGHYGCNEQAQSHDVIAGGIFIAIAAFFAAEGWRYDFGSAIQMGPGFFPVVLAGLLALFGLFVMVGGFRKEPDVSGGPVPWRGMILICAALALFAAGARTLGLVRWCFLHGAHRTGQPQKLTSFGMRHGRGHGCTLLRRLQGRTRRFASHLRPDLQLLRSQPHDGSSVPPGARL